jgi:hypothetical protein
MKINKIKEALKSTIAKKLYKSFILVICFVGLLLVLTNPNLNDFKDFSPSDGTIYKNEWYLSKEKYEIGQKKEKEYLLFSIYSDKIILRDSDESIFRVDTYKYLGIFNNFYYISPKEWYYDKNGILRSRDTY